VKKHITLTYLTVFIFVSALQADLKNELQSLTTNLQTLLKELKPEKKTSTQKPSLLGVINDLKDYPLPDPANLTKKILEDFIEDIEDKISNIENKIYLTAIEIDKLPKNKQP